VAAEGDRVGGDDLRIGDPPAVAPEQAQVLRVGRMDVEGDLERLPRPLGELGDLPELVDLQAEGPAALFDGPVRAAPAGGGRKAVALALGADGPLLQHDRLPDWAPADPAGRDGAGRGADVLADREIPVVAGEARPGVAGGVPVLGEAGIEVD